MNAPILLLLVLSISTILVKAVPIDNSQDSNIFLNDMRFVEAEERSAVADERKRWTNGIVPVHFDSTFTEREKSTLEKGLQMINSTTCIKFRLATSTDQRSYSYVYIQRGKKSSGCYSYVGRSKRGAQELNIEPDSYCMQPGPIAHEMLHAIGLHHEMSRPDRDDYIIIQEQNMQNGVISNWRKEPSSLTYGTKYDYLSLMHYGSRAGTKNGQAVMLNKQRQEIKMGQLEKLTDSDVAKVKAMYKCP